MSNWFARTFGEVFGHLPAEGRHEILGGWFGRSFEPHPTHPLADAKAEREIADRADTHRAADFYGLEHER